MRNNYNFSEAKICDYKQILMETGSIIFSILYLDTCEMRDFARFTVSAFPCNCWGQIHPRPVSQKLLFRWKALSPTPFTSLSPSPFCLSRKDEAARRRIAKPAASLAVNQKAFTVDSGRRKWITSKRSPKRKEILSGKSVTSIVLSANQLDEFLYFVFLYKILSYKITGIFCCWNWFME